MDPLAVALWALMVGATSAGMTTVLRALPLVQKWMWAFKKPWVCDICMSFWTVALLSLGLALLLRNAVWILVSGPAYPWALWVLRKTSDPHGQPPPMPPLEE
jgi:hypothetical protein